MRVTFQVDDPDQDRISELVLAVGGYDLEMTEADATGEPTTAPDPQAEVDPPGKPATPIDETVAPLPDSDREDEPPAAA